VTEAYLLNCLLLACVRCRACRSKMSATSTGSTNTTSSTASTSSAVAAASGLDNGNGSLVGLAAGGAQITSKHHEHKLDRASVATNSADAAWVCKVCLKQGIGSCYRCALCNFYLCKKCLKEELSASTSSPEKKSSEESGTVAHIKPQSLSEILPKTGLVYSEKANLCEVLCKPKIMPLKSLTLEKIEQMERDAQRMQQRQQLLTTASPAGGRPDWRSPH